MPTETEPRVLDCDDALTLLRAAVQAKGADHIYQPKPNGRGDRQCYYLYGDQPDCIVGHVLLAAGWTLDEVYSVEETTPGSYQCGLWSQRLTERAAALLDYTQINQDRGLPWGKAVDDAVAQMEADGMAPA
jgi:hypothetical protein